MYCSTLPSTSALDGGWVFSATPRPFYPRERNSTYCIGGWVGPWDCVDGCGKSHPHLDSIPGPSQPVASRYTDCAILAHTKIYMYVYIRIQLIFEVESKNMLITVL